LLWSPTFAFHGAYSGDKAFRPWQQCVLWQRVAFGSTDFVTGSKLFWGEPGAFRKQQQLHNNHQQNKDFRNAEKTAAFKHQ
jgi:hypothetical protein